MKKMTTLSLASLALLSSTVIGNVRQGLYYHR